MYTLERDFAVSLAREVGELLLEHRRRGVAVDFKNPNNPVTVADLEASALTLERLQVAFPEDGFLSEEQADNPRRLSNQRVWIVDPIDGTREYAAGHDDYSYSLGLVVNGVAVLGVVYAPSRNALYLGLEGEGVTLGGQRVGFSARAPEDSVVSVSDTEHRHTLHRYPLTMAPSGSIALKLARVASGESDATFTIGPRSEWDLAGGAAMLRELGGVLRDRGGQEIVFNQPRPYLLRGLIAGKPGAVAWLERRLHALDMPEKRLMLTPESELWGQLPAHWSADATHHVHALMAPTGVVGAVVLEQGEQGWSVAHSRGEVERLVRDLQREYGPLEG